MRDSLTAAGGGSTMVGMICLLAGTQTTHHWLGFIGIALVVIGVALLFIRTIKHWKS